MKKIIGLLVVSALGLGIWAFTPKTAATDTYMTLDINPSVELIVTPSERIIYANALNEDGEVLLVELKLVGKKLDIGIDLIIEKSIELGFIEPNPDVETIVSVTAISENNRIAELMKEKVKDKIDKAMEDKEIPGHAEDKPDQKYIPEFLIEARSYGVSPGFYFLAQKAVYSDEKLTLEAALEMSVSELQAIIRNAKDQFKTDRKALQETFKADLAALRETYVPQFEDFETQIAQIEAQIEITEDELEKESLAAELKVLVEDYLALKLEFRTQFKAIRSQYIEELKALKVSFKETLLDQIRRGNHHHEHDDGRPNSKSR